MKERLFIIPTVTGLMFLIIAVIIYIVGALYLNNLAYLMGHLIFSLIVCSMVISNNNIKGLSVESISMPILMVEESGRGEIIVRNKKKDSKENVGLKLSDHRLSATPAHIDEKMQFDLPMNKSKRGVFRVGKITLFSDAPFGLFYCWKNFINDQEFYVYPKAVNFLEASFTAIENRESQERKVSPIQGDELTYSRNFSIGDSPFRADWFSLARGHKLQVKEFRSLSGGAIEIDLNKLENLTLEQKLSQASYWVKEAIQKGYTISFSGLGTFPPEKGGEVLIYLAKYPGVESD